MNARSARATLVGAALAAALVLGGAGGAAAGGVLAEEGQRAALVWQPLAVEHPVAIDAAGWPAEARAAKVAGAVTVGPRRAARVRLAALATARVRTIGAGAPVFERVTGAVRVAESPALLAPGTWLIEQPPGEASDWLVTAPTDTRVVIEGVRPRTGDLIWEHAIGSVLRWIDEGGPPPPLPEVPEAETVAQALAADEEIAAALWRVDDSDHGLREAVRAWRRAAAIQRIHGLRAPIRSAFGLELRARPLTGAAPIRNVGASGWQRVAGRQRHVIPLRGPGVLWIEARAIGGAGEIRVAAAGRRLAAATLRTPASAANEVAGGTGAKGQVEVAGGTGAKGQVEVSGGTGVNGGVEGVVDRRGEGGRSGEDVDLGAAESAATGRGDLGTSARLAGVLGVPVGAASVLRVPLAPGLRDYEIEFAGPDTAVNLRAGRTNPRLVAAIRGEDVAAQIRRGRRALRRSGSSRARLVAALLDGVDGRPVRPGKADPDVVLALAQAELAAQADGLSPAEEAEVAERLARRAARVPVGPLVWRARTTGLALAGTDPALARALAGSHPAEAPTEVIERLASAIEGPPLALRSPAVALLELARRRAPLDAGVRAAYRERWKTGTRWAALRADEAAGAGWTWIEPRPAADERVAGARALWRWPLGQPQVIEMAPVEGRRLPLLRMYAEVPGEAGAIGMQVGERRWIAPVLARVERWQVALPPGRYPVTLTGPAGTTVWSSRAPAPGRAPEGHLLRLWPAAPGETVRFVLPAGAEPGYVRVELRALGERSGATRVWVARDDEAPQAIDVRLPAVDPAVVPVQATERVGGRAVAVVRIEAGTKVLAVRVAEEGLRVAITASIRATRGRVEAEAIAGRAGLAAGTGVEKSDELAAGTGVEKADELAAGTGVEKSGGLAAGTGVEKSEEVVAGTGAREDTVDLVRLEGLSRGLQADPEAKALRLERAELLLDLDQPGYAYVDWQAVTSGGLPRDLLGPALALADRLDALDAPDTIDLTTSGPAIVTPAIAAAIDGDVARMTAVAPAVAAARVGGPKAGLAALDRMADGDPKAGLKDRSAAAAVLRAGWLDERGEADAAARVWAGLEAQGGLWQAGLMGVHSFLAALDGASARPGSLLRPTPGEPRADGAALAYGLALSLRRTVRTPAIQRLATVAATRSRWAGVESSERDAGVESLTVPRAPSLPSPNAAVRQALVIPPWPHAEATLLRPGYATVLALRREASALAVDLWCEEVRPGLGEEAVVRVTLDGVDLFRGPVAPRSVTGPSIEGLPAGRHRVEVELDANSRGHLCSVRLADRVGVVGSVRATTWRVARVGTPVEVAVLGPTTLAIEARALLPGDARRPGAAELELSLARGRERPALRERIALPAEADPQATPESARTIVPGLAATRMLALTEPGPHRVVLSTARGSALVRVRQRLDGEPVPVPRAPVRSLDLGAIVDEVGPIGLPPPTLPSVASPPRAVQRFGTTFAEARVGSDDLDGADDLQPRLTGTVRLGWARALVPRKLWLTVAPELLPRAETSMTGGGSVALQVMFPQAGLRGRAFGEALGSRALGEPAWALRAGVRVDRPTWVAPRWQLLPSIELTLRAQSIGPAGQAAMEPIHPRIYSAYAGRHPVALRPGLEVRWQRWQDARVYAATDVVGIDQWNLRGGMVGVLAVLRRVVPEFAVEYEASIRWDDAVRARTYVQNRVRAGAGVGVWAGKAARVVVGVSDALFASGLFPLRNVLDVWLRVDMTLGRGLRDYGPLDMAFRPVREPRLWLGSEVP